MNHFCCSLFRVGLAISPSLPTFLQGPDCGTIPSSLMGASHSVVTRASHIFVWLRSALSITLYEHWEFHRFQRGSSTGITP